MTLPPLLAATLLWGLTLGSAYGIITAQFKAQATIVAGCAVLGTGSLFGTLSFGTYSGTGTGSVSGTFVQNTSLTLACTPGVSLSMAINGGSNFTTVRNVMQSGNSLQLPYRIYSNAAHTNEIIVNQNVPLNISSSNNNIILPIYGVLQLNGFSPSGSYTDTLTVTLTW
ncbi:spore coat U domain-containing protein [Hafnia alvei]|uniref:Spore coat protein U (SCPU) domain-containing protein n=1 Tax=Hafnia alvei TaxID=569 RepID=A0A1C6YVU5_HAFAL|nr:spore coat U domain-containing protein [Hafnia alvei]NLS56250.1 fimbrial major subunit CsuA/B family protein [Hafnia alvei]SCM50964.1 Spore coat protein U (SCPU) domain-containing protein [Hafnia alvei]